jgi:hypothetical protein
MTNLERLEADIRAKLPRLTIKEERVIGSDTFWANPEILLSDVLEWLGMYDSDPELFCITSAGSIKVWKYDRFEYASIRKNKTWDLSKPHLCDQSQELIDYLTTLI